MSSTAVGVVAGAGAGAVAAVVTVLAVGAAAARVPVSDDEAWFLQVLERCRSGERLYRDVFFGAAPLSIWFGRIAIRISRPQLLVLRAMTLAYFASTLLAGSWLLLEVGAPTWTVVGAWFASVAYGAPSWGPDNHYGQLTILFGLVSIAAVAARLGGDPWPMSLFAGVASGAAIGSKHNVGVVVAVASATLLLGERSAVDLAAFTAGALVMMLGWIAPLLRDGTGGAFVQRAFTNKASYLATGRIGLVDGARQLFLPFLDDGPVAVATRTVIRTAFVVVGLVPVAMVVDVLVLVRGGDRAVAVAAAAGLAAGAIVLAGLYPRADQPHVQALVPVANVALLLTLHAAAGWLGPALPAPIASSGAAAVTVWIAVALVLALDTRHRIPFEADQVDREVPHLRGLPVVRRAGLRPEEREELRRATGGRVFLLRPDAGLWYLAADLRNPTPYDYPFASVFGARGQAETVAAIERGDIEWVCWPDVIRGPLAPVELQDFIASSMEPAADAGSGTIYRLRAHADHPS
jgi:hypothetical protein